MAITITQKDIDGLEPLQPGTYQCAIRTAKPGKSQAGNEKVTIIFVVEAGEHEDRVIIYSPIFTDEDWAIRRVLELLQVVDHKFGPGDIIDPETVAEALMAYAGALDVSITHREMPDGGIMENVTRVRKASGDAVDTLLADDAEIPF